MKTTIRRFSARVNGVQLVGLCDVEDHGGDILIARCTDLYVEGCEVPVLEVIDMGIIIDLEEMCSRMVSEGT